MNVAIRHVYNDSNECFRCRRQLLAEHFGERWEDADCSQQCDHCLEPRLSKTMSLDLELSQLTQILENAANMEQKLTGTTIRYHFYSNIYRY